MKNGNLLSKIKLPQDVRKLSLSQKEQLCSEIRETLISNVSKTGGHLASSLGTVELTVALHSVFSTPSDKIVWDVGHQAYTHKILTGRLDRLDTIRQTGGISGFPKPSESEHDAFISGHSSNSISAAYGLAAAMKLQGDSEHSVIAVIGDGAMTGGMAFEGLNNAGKGNENLIIVLNQNNMSISKNVGAIARYLNNIRTTNSYYNAKVNVKSKVGKTPVIGKNLTSVMSSVKRSLKNAIYHSNLFEDFGFSYFGPIDGHDIELLTKTLRTAKKLKKPVLIHIDTTKGKGLPQAEENPGSYHGMPKCDPNLYTDTVWDQNNYSNVFGKELAELAEADDRICAVTAAMKYGTGLQFFYSKFKKRFFDVGIAEQHAVTFSAGLAAQGMLPVFAVYSSFLQRSYDQILHDCAIENTHVVLGIDRAGIVGEDGVTHQGIFDAAFVSSIPNTTILSPSSYSELKWCLKAALYDIGGVAALRYPRGESDCEDLPSCKEGEFYLHEKSDNPDCLIVTYGRIFAEVCKARQSLFESGINADLIKLLKIHPADEEVIAKAMEYKNIIFVEEGIRSGGISEHYESRLLEKGFKGRTKIIAVDDEFIEHGTVKELFKIIGLDSASIEKTVRREIELGKA